jgi:type III pantothenate kinase
VSDRVVVDVGNTRIKWGRCRGGHIAEVAALPPGDTDAWQRQLDSWRLHHDVVWVVSGVHPERRDVLLTWLDRRGAKVHRLEGYRDLPLDVQVDEPERVGIDRLLNAVAANGRRGVKVPALIVDAGSAVTVDYVDGAGSFRGGAIYPGLRLMSQSLHDYTAKLPVVPVGHADPPGTSTRHAIQAGVYYAVLGGAERLIDAMCREGTPAPQVFLTGGDAELLAARLARAFTLWPEMTLEGINASVAAST